MANALQNMTGEVVITHRFQEQLLKEVALQLSGYLVAAYKIVATLFVLLGLVESHMF
jgi:hypothetical protein